MSKGARFGSDSELDGRLGAAGGGARALLMLLGGLTALGPFSIDLYLPGLPSMAHELRASPAWAQQTVSAYFLGLAFGQLLHGPLSDRFGRRPPLLAGLALYALAAVGCATAPSVAVLCGWRVLQALGACAALVISRAAVRDLFSAREVLHVFALLTSVMSISPLVAPLVGGLLLTVTSWRVLFLFQAVAGLGLGVAVWLRLPESRSAATAAQARAEPPWGAYLALLRRPAVMFPLAIAACSGAVLYVWVAGSANLVMQVYHFPPQRFGLVFGANTIALVGATQLNALLARRYAPLRLLRFGVLGAVAAALLLAVCAHTGLGGMWGVFAGFFLLMASLGFSQTNASVAAINVDPTRSGSTAALIGAGVSLTGFAATALVGALGDGAARAMSEVIVAAVLVGWTVLAAWSASRGVDKDAAHA